MVTGPERILWASDRCSMCDTAVSYARDRCGLCGQQTAVVRVVTGPQRLVWNRTAVHVCQRTATACVVTRPLWPLWSRTEWHVIGDQCPSSVRVCFKPQYSRPIFRKHLHTTGLHKFDVQTVVEVVTVMFVLPLVLMWVTVLTVIFAMNPVLPQRNRCFHKY